MAEWIEGPPETVDWEKHAASIDQARLYKQQRDELLSAYKVWKDATVKRCKLLSSREATDSMLFPDQAFIEAVERVRKGVDGG